MKHTLVLDRNRKDTTKQMKNKLLSEYTKKIVSKSTHE